MRKIISLFLVEFICISLLTISLSAQSRDLNEKCDFSSEDTLQVIPKDLYLLLKEQPVYPKTARRKKVKGDVSVRVLLNREGLAERMCVVKGHKLLVPSVLAVIRKWRYPKDSIQKDLSSGNHKYLEFVVTYTFK